MLDRWTKIRKMLDEQGYISVETFVKELKVSEATIRRDLNYLEDKGLVKRIHGGAEKVQQDFQNAEVVSKRLLNRSEVKKRIAKAAATTVNNGDFIYMDSSSTVYYMLDYIEASDITVVTNAVLLLPKLMDLGIRTYVLNGFIDCSSESILIDDVNSQINMLNFDKAFFGTFGINEKTGYTTYDFQEGSYKKSVLKQSKKSYVLADDTKFQKSAFYSYASLEDCTLVTNNKNEVTEHIKDIIICY